MKDRREKAALTMSITMDRSSTDDHGHHLTVLRRPEVSSTLRSGQGQDKREVGGYTRASKDRCGQCSYGTQIKTQRSIETDRWVLFRNGIRCSCDSLCLGDKTRRPRGTVHREFYFHSGRRGCLPPRPLRHRSPHLSLHLCLHPRWLRQLLPLQQ